MPADHNGESNGGFRVRWKTLPVIVAMIVAISTGIGGYALSGVRSATTVELRSTANEKKLTSHDKTLSLLKDGQADIKGDLKTIVTDLGWIKKNMEKRHP